MSRENPTSVDLILADTDPDRIRLEKMLGVSQEQMADFFYARFFEHNKVCFLHSPAQTSQQRLDAIRAVILGKQAP